MLPADTVWVAMCCYAMLLPAVVVLLAAMVLVWSAHLYATLRILARYLAPHELPQMLLV